MCLYGGGFLSFFSISICSRFSFNFCQIRKAATDSWTAETKRDIYLLNDLIVRPKSFNQHICCLIIWRRCQTIKTYETLPLSYPIIDYISQSSKILPHRKKKVSSIMHASLTFVKFSVNIFRASSFAGTFIPILEKKHSADKG